MSQSDIMTLKSLMRSFDTNCISQLSYILGPNWEVIDAGTFKFDDDVALHKCSNKPEIKPKTDKYGQPLTYIQRYVKNNDYPIVNEVIDDILNRIKEKNLKLKTINKMSTFS